MEKEKTKLWKKILIIVLLLVVAFIIFITSKAVILVNLDKKVSDCENSNTNIYVKEVIKKIDGSEHIVKEYVKDDIYKKVIEVTTNEGKTLKTTEIIYPNERKAYTDSGETKTMGIYKEKAPIRTAHFETASEKSYSIINNFAYGWTIWDRIINALFTKINTVEMNGKQCYELKGTHFYNFHVLNENGKELIAYVEKDTGLPVKLIETINQNGKIQENVSVYEIKFGSVTDDDMKEPDASEYKLEY